MNCLRCNTPNEEEAKFCKNCGMDMTYTPSNSNTNSDKTINQLLVFLGIFYFIEIGWMVVDKLVFPIILNDATNFERMTIYRYMGWTISIIKIITLLVLSIIVKNKNARIFLIIFLIIQIVSFLVYRVFENID